MVLLAACSSNPHKATQVETEIENKQEIGRNEELGVKDGNMVVQRKTLMSEELRRLQTEVYETEDKVYGNRKYGSKGLYGVLKECRMKLADKKNGGDGKLMWTEPMARVTEKEEALNIGLDEKDQIVGVSEEFLKDRLERFRGYKSLLAAREDEMQDKVDICNAELKSRMHENTTFVE